MTYPFRNIVLSGGGIWGVAYAGVASVLAERGIYNNIERMAGVSAGAIFATLMNVGYDAADLARIVRTTNFGAFEDRPNMFGIFFRYGIFKGEVFRRWMRDMIAKSPMGQGNPDLTFGELKQRSNRELYVFASNLTARRFMEFSARKTPDYKIADAVRASMSLPLVFESWTIRDAGEYTGIYADGGMMNSYPINFFDDPPFVLEGTLANVETLGFMFTPPEFSDAPVRKLQYDHGHLDKYLKLLLETVITGFAQAIKVPADMRRTVMTDAALSHISSKDFKATPQQLALLVEAGRNSTLLYLDDYLRQHSIAA